ncbi:MAG: hypothetical protein FWE90_05380 [Defluviitaleaceae bacterium]|nr:hypothetical protein [Defluviitaleaceae bacterium]
MDEFDEMMKSLGINGSQEEEEPSPPRAAEETFEEDLKQAEDNELDAQLERMIKADQDAKDEYEPMDVGPLVSTRSIYDAGGIIDDTAPGALVYMSEEERASAGKVKRGKRSLLAGLTVRRLLMVGFFLLLIFCGVGYAVVRTTRVIAEQRGIVASMAHFTPISLSQDVPNNANFVMINEKHTLGGQGFTLSRLAPGLMGTYLYFEETFDPDDFIILLYDQARNLYVRQSFDINHDPVLGTVLRFDPLRFDVAFLTLHIQYFDTRDYVEFNYRIIGPITFGSPVFITQPVSLLPGGDPNDGLRISHAEFSNIDSVIHYSFTGQFAGVGLRQRDGSNNTFLHIRDNFGGPAVFTGGQSTAHFPSRDAFVGRATFGPVFNLDSLVNLSFRDLYYVYPYPPVDIPLRHLSGRDQSKPHTLYLEPFRLNLEAIAQQGHLLVMVMHGTDDRGYRLPTLVEASLEIDLGRGNTLTIPAEQVNVAPIGTDIVFNLRPHVETLQNVHIDRYTLILHAVEFSVPEVSVTLDLAYAVNQPGLRRETAVHNIESAFMSRLSYMSGAIAFRSIVGFAPGVLNDEEAMAPFTPRTLSERPMYGVTVVAGDFIDNYTFMAVVESEWAVGQGRDLQFLRTVHHVIAASRGGVWSIVSDERIK